MNIKTKLLELAVNYINQVMETECIYCFGVRTALQTKQSIFSNAGLEERNSIHFDMLVVTTNRCPLPDFIGQLENITDMYVTVSLIVCTHAALYTELKNNNRFFHSIIRKGKLINSKIGKDPVHPCQFDQEMDRSATRRYWNKCFKNGMANLDTALNSYHDYKTAIPFYTKSLKQICEGLIYVYLGYQPTGYSLEQMLDLCTSIDQQIDELFPKVTERNVFHYDILMQGFWEKADGQDMEPFMDEIHRCCEEFTNYAALLCRLRLDANSKAEL